MKTSIKKSFHFIVLSLFTICSLFFVSCSDDEIILVEPPLASATSDQLVNIPFFVLTADGNMPSNPDDLLYDARMKNPVLAPDGHQVTWAEYSAVRGSINVDCTEAGVKVNFRVTGLIPDGVYTAWNISVKAPGFDPAAEMFNITGIGAAGKGDGSDNTFVAGPDGTAELTTISKGGPLSMIGEMAHCPLDGQFEWHVVVAYHIDGKTYGGNIGPDGTVVEQFGFIFQHGN